jgi:asparagine synthetase B (glutamine-hydrolysing)
LQQPCGSRPSASSCWRAIFGEKPLYYSELRDGSIVFASEITALTKFPGVDLELNRQAIWDFPTFLWIPEPATVYHHVLALARGHILIADDRGARLRAYQNRFDREPLPSHDADAVIAETRRVVEQAVKSRLLSDVPVGSFLSEHRYARGMSVVDDTQMLLAAKWGATVIGPQGEVRIVVTKR